MRKVGASGGTRLCEFGAQDSILPINSSDFWSRLGRPQLQKPLEGSQVHSDNEDEDDDAVASVNISHDLRSTLLDFSWEKQARSCLSVYKHELS